MLERDYSDYRVTSVFHIIIFPVTTYFVIINYYLDYLHFEYAE